MKLKNYIQKPTSFIFIVLVIISLGFFSLFNLPVKMYPQIKKPMLRVQFSHTSLASPKDLYQTIGKHIEEDLSNLEGIENIQSTYYQGRGNVQLDFEWEQETESLKESIKTILSGHKSKYPNHFNFNITSGRSKSSGNMLIAVGHKKLPPHLLRSSLDTKLLPEIRKLEDVSSINTWGWKSENIVLKVDREKLLTFNISPSDIKMAIKQSLKSHLTGRISHGHERGAGSSITVPTSLKKLSDLEQVLIKKTRRKGYPIRVKDVGVIENLFRESASIYQLNGVPAKFLMVEFKDGGDLKRSSDNVSKLLINLKKEDPSFVTQVIVNPSYFISQSIKNLLFNATFGGVMAILVVYLFLRAWSNTIIIGLSIPFCLISSFILMNIFDISINIISLGGLAIGVGLILDGAIVTLDNIYRLFEEEANKNENNGPLSKDKKVSLILQGTREVAMPVTVSLLTSLVTFIPLIFSTSYTQAVLGNLAKTIVFSLSLSIFSSLIIVPVMSYFFLKPKINKKEDENLSGNVNEKTISKLGNSFNKVLNYFIKTKKRSFLTIIMASFVGLCSLFLIPKIKKEIIAIPATRLMDIRLHFEGNKDINASKKVVNKIESFFSKRAEVNNIATYLWSPAYGMVTLELKDRDQFPKLRKLVQEHFPSTPIVQIRATKWNPGKLPLPRERHLVVNLHGAKEKEMTSFSNKIRALRHQYNAGAWRRPWINPAEEVSLSFFQWVSQSVRNEVMELLRTSTQNGSYVETLFFDGIEKGLRLIFKDHQQNAFLEDVKYLPVTIKERIIPLKALAEVELKERSYIPLSIIDGKSAQQVFISFRKGKTDKKVNQYKEAISKIEKPEGLTIEYPELNKEIKKSFESFKTSLIISIALIFFLILLFFNSIKYPLVILSTVFFGLSGVLGGLYIADSTLSLNSMLGAILLSGLVVNNAILIVDFYKKEKERLNNSMEALKKAMALRIRPILLTTLTTLLGVIPIALALGEAGEILQPLGIAVFFGLLVSTVLTLIVVPCFLRLTDSL